METLVRKDTLLLIKAFQRLDFSTVTKKQILVVTELFNRLITDINTQRANSTTGDN